MLRSPTCDSVHQFAFQRNLFYTYTAKIEYFFHFHTSTIVYETSLLSGPMRKCIALAVGPLFLRFF